MFEQSGFDDNMFEAIDYTNVMWGLKRAKVLSVYPNEYKCDIQLSETGNIFKKVPVLSNGGVRNNKPYMTFDLPEQDDTVIIGFLDGNSVAPFIIGRLFFYTNPKLEPFLNEQDKTDFFIRHDRGFEIRISSDEKCYIQKNSGNSKDDGTLRIEIDFANDKIKIGATGTYEKLFKCETVQAIINANNALYNAHTHPGGSPPVTPLTDIQSSDFSEIIETE